jgi:hypothetical protein
LKEVLRRLFGELNEMKIGKWRKRYSEELNELFAGLDILSFIRIRRLHWIGHINRMG